jgi:hypothetical protein
MIEGTQIVWGSLSMLRYQTERGLEADLEAQVEDAMTRASRIQLARLNAEIARRILAGQIQC